MNIYSVIALIVGISLSVVSIVLILYTHYRNKHVISHLGKMLDEAMNGDFLQISYDESTLSALESKLGRYLKDCAVSGQNLLAEKEKIKELISDISHQTKTPVANILLYSQLIGEYDLPEDCKDMVHSLVTQGEKLNFLIGALVKMSRLETGIVVVKPERNRVNQLLTTVIEQIKPKAEAKGVTINCDTTATVASFDLKWTQEAIYNIVDNAVKYTASNGQVDIQVIEYPMFCCIEISDNGKGIKDEEHCKIFSRFYRSGDVQQEEGVGIGLFLAREIIQAENGYIKVKSIFRQGSTFSVFLPMQKI